MIHSGERLSGFRHSSSGNMHRSAWNWRIVITALRWLIRCGSQHIPEENTEEEKYPTTIEPNHKINQRKEYPGMGGYFACLRTESEWVAGFCLPLLHRTPMVQPLI